MATTTETRTAGFVDTEKKYGENKAKSLWPVKWIDPPGRESVVFAKAGAEAIQGLLGKPHEYKISTGTKGESVVEVVGIWKSEGSGGGRSGQGTPARTAEDRALEAAIAGHRIAARLTLGLAPEEAIAFVEREGGRLVRVILASAGGTPVSSPASTGSGGSKPPADVPSEVRRVANEDGEPLATPGQIKALQTLASKIGWDDAERHAIAGVSSFHDLTKEQAGNKISAWQEVLDGSRDVADA